MKDDKVAYLGLGSMGYQIAGHIARKAKEVGASPVLVWNRTKEKSLKLERELDGAAKATETIAEVAKNADIVFTCLINDAAVEQVVTELLKHLKEGSVIVEQSTIAPGTAQRLAELSSKSGVHYLGCPVMGPPQKAKSAELVLLLAGNEEQRQRVLGWTHNVIGTKVIELGNDVQQASQLKLCGNFFVTSSVEMLAEGLTLGAKAGVGQDKVKELVDTVFPGSLLSVYSARMVNQTYLDQIAFSLAGAKKDTGHILDLAKETGAALPITNVFMEHINQAIAYQNSELEDEIDFSGVVGVLRQKAGLPFNLQDPKPT